MDRPFSAENQRLADIYREQLRPLAESIERESTAAAYSTRRLLKPSAQAKARKQRRREARDELWKQVNRCHPMGLGVIEIWIMQWVIGQLLNWIMREWIAGDDSADQD